MADIDVFYCEVNLSVQEFGSNLPAGASGKKTKIGSNMAQGHEQKTYCQEPNDLAAADEGHHVGGCWFWHGSMMFWGFKMGEWIIGMAAVWARRLWMLYWGGVRLLACRGDQGHVPTSCTAVFIKL